MIIMPSDMQIIVCILGITVITRQLYIKSLVNKIPKKIKKLKLPYKGKNDLVKDKDDLRYITFDSPEGKKNKIIPPLPFEKKGSAFYFQGQETIDYSFFKYDKELCKNLKKGDKITSIQFRIPTGYYFLLGEPSGNRISTTPKTINLNNDQIKIFLANFSSTEKLSENQDDIINKINSKTSHQGLKWDALDWPFGEKEINNWGPHIFFENPLIYNGEALLLYFYENNKNHLFHLDAFNDEIYDSEQKYFFGGVHQKSNPKYNNSVIAMKIGIKK